jgi:hypothetical protein
MTSFEYIRLSREVIEKIHRWLPLQSTGFNSEGNLQFILNTVDGFPELAGIIPRNSTDKVIWLASYLLFHLTKGHCFNDGNKRTAFASTNYFLQLNGFIINVADKVIKDKEECIERVLREGGTIDKAINAAFADDISSNEYRLAALIFGLSGVIQLGNYSSPIDIYPIVNSLIIGANKSVYKV